MMNFKQQFTRPVVRCALVFILTVGFTFLLASVVGTQIVLADIQSFGLEVSFGDRVSATFHDIAGLAPTLIALIGATFLVAFVIAALCKRYLGGKRTYWYLAAGFTSIPAALWLIKSIMGVTLFAAARTGPGMLLIAICGLVGASLFIRLTQKRDV